MFVRGEIISSEFARIQCRAIINLKGEIICFKNKSYHFTLRVLAYILKDTHGI